uniref:Putative chaperone n=1 Tax=viral metagenome TaxID=1070528 RepID=A0A6M3K604_9ZZZZ
MTHAEICPVCKGTGEKVVKESTSYGTCTFETKCNGCGGKGWIAIEDKNESSTPYCTFITYPPYPYNPYTTYSPYLTYYGITCPIKITSTSEEKK